jgi:hypothetical protein
LDLEVAAGINGGYRFELGAGFYVTPWLGVGYAFAAEKTTLGGETFEPMAWTIFPAVHLGYRFR